MKKISLILLFSLCFTILGINIYSGFFSTSFSLSANTLKIGDVNNDGKVGSTDYILIRKYISGTVTLTDIQKQAADVNSDNKISSLDYIKIKQIVISGEKNVVTPTSTPKPTATPTSKPTVAPTPAPQANPNSISLNKTTLSLDGGSTANLTVSYNPSNVTNKNVTWSSNNVKVAHVDANGKVTANLSGTAVITAKTSNGKTASCTVTVTVNITYKEIRYDQGDGNATTIWYAIIPSKYKMHYVFANNIIKAKDKPSNIAKKNNAVIAVNAHILGFPYVNGKRQEYDQDVSGYDFIVKKNPNFKELSINSPPWEALIVTATKDYTQGISFKDINLGYSYDGDHLYYNGRKLYMALFHQIVMNGKGLNYYPPLNQNSDFWKKYYFELETKQEERHPRTWLAYDSKGNQFVAVATGRNYPLRDGKFIGQAGLTFHEIIKVTKKYFGNDIVTIYNLDGGGSSAFVYKGQKLNGNGDVDSKGNRYERDVTGLFYW